MTRVAVGPSPIDPSALLGAVSAPSHGAVVLFVGMVRDHADGHAVTGIEYTAYEAMAVQELERIVAETEARHGAVVAAAHRLGTLAVTDVSIVVAAGHPHRDRAFAAAREAVEEAKRRLPVWKHEHRADGTREWVGASIGAAGTAVHASAGAGGAAEGKAVDAGAGAPSAAP